MLSSGQLVDSLRCRTAHEFRFDCRARPRTRENLDSVSAIGQPVTFIFNKSADAGRSILATCTVRDRDPP